MAGISGVRATLNSNLKDVDTLIEIHNELRSGSVGRPKQKLEVLKRSAIILIVAAWEAYIEDTLIVRYRRRLKRAKSPRDAGAAFNALAERWLNPDPNQGGKPKPPELANWTRSGWKELLAKRCEEEVADLNTPNSINVGILLKRYLSVDPSIHWNWHKNDPKKVRQRLNNLISLRGEISHRMRASKPVRLGTVRNARDLICRIADSIERALAKKRWA